eukprot:3611639-Pyramimonas_sp.AAC.1
MDKLAGVKASAAAEAKRIDAQCNEMVAEVKDATWDGSVKKVREQLKELVESQRLATCHAIATKRLISDAKAQCAKRTESGAQSKKRKSAFDDAPQMEVDLESNLGPAMQVIASETRGKHINI